MAVVPMQKVQVVVHQHDVDDFLATAQRFAAMEFTQVAGNTLTELSGEAPHAQLLPRVQHAVGFLAPYETKRGLWRTLREGSLTQQTEQDIANRLSDTDAVASIVADVEALQVELAEKTSRVKFLEEQRALLQTWAGVTNALSGLDTAATTSLLVTKPADVKESLLDVVATALADVDAHGVQAAGDGALVTVLRTLAPAAEAALTDANLTIVARPQGTQTATVELAKVEEELAAAKGEQGVVHDQAEHAAQTHLAELRISGELLEWERDRFTTLETGKSTNATAVFDGWLMAEQRPHIEAALTKANVAAAFTDMAVAEDEEPPVEIANRGIFQPFEFVTRLYGMPGYKDLDPTMFLAGFFFLFFGLALTDVGYGVFLMAVATLFLTLFKVAPGVRTFMKLLFCMGAASALVGLLFGGYLGIAPEALPEWTRAIQLFDPIGNPLPVFYLALGLGVVQVMVGMLLKIYSDSRNDQLVEGILDQGPWLFLFTVGILYVGVVIGYVSFVSTDVLTKLAYLGVALVALSSGRKGKTIAGKFIAALAALYNDGIGYFSDVLSYSRLLALGLATSALAFAVNLIAELVSGTPVVGPILAVAVVVVGHLFALAINTLGAFIHSARLQFIEFFGKFIAGTGRAFAPLARSSRHITAQDE